MIESSPGNTIFSIGEKVLFNGEQYTIIGLDGNAAWIKGPWGERFSAFVKHLEKIN